MRTDIYGHCSYKNYLRAVEQENSRGGRGFRSRLARLVKCNVAYISQVLNKTAQLSPDQAEVLNGFLEHSRDEADYFLLLVQLDRAGSAKLAERLRYQLERKTQDRLLLRNRVGVTQSLNQENQIRYYSSWHYSAVHVALSIPGLFEIDPIAKALKLSPARVTEIMEFLLQVGLAVKVGAKFKIGTSRIFLKSDSPMVWKHHTNWRMRAIQAFDSSRVDDLHLSTVFTASAEDIPVMKSEILKCIENVRKNIKQSKEELVYCFNVDFFGL